MPLLLLLLDELLLVCPLVLLELLLLEVCPLLLLELLPVVVDPHLPAVHELEQHWA